MGRREIATANIAGVPLFQAEGFKVLVQNIVEGDGDVLGVPSRTTQHRFFDRWLSHDVQLIPGTSDELSVIPSARPDRR